MAAVTQVVPNFLGGVSKQTDHKKLPGQVRECLNAYPDPTFGLMKRPGFKFIKTLHESSNPNSPDFADAKWFFIKRDNQETYIGNISGPFINIWNKDGVPATVSYPNGTGYLDTTRDNYDILTVQDTSIITNKTKEIGTKAAPTDHIPDSHATIRLLQTAYSSKYDVNIQIGSSAVFQAATYTTINAYEIVFSINISIYVFLIFGCSLIRMIVTENVVKTRNLSILNDICYPETICVFRH